MDLPKSLPKKIEPTKLKGEQTKVMPRRKPVAKQTAGIIAKRPKPNVKVEKSAVAPKKTTTLCKVHRKAMKYDSTLGYWKCPEAGCAHKSRPKVGGSSSAPTVIKGEPKIIVNYDVDGDAHYLLQYDDLGIIVELPFTAVLGHKVYNQNIDSSVVVNLKSTNVVFVDNAGDIIPIEKAKDR